MDIKVGGIISMKIPCTLVLYIFYFLKAAFKEKNFDHTKLLAVKIPSLTEYILYTFYYFSLKYKDS